jgi:hypothetical protein
MGETFKKLITLIIAIVTVITSVIAFLQNDAGNRDDIASRDANTLAIEILGRRIEGVTQVNYDYDEAFELWRTAIFQGNAAAELGSRDSTIQRYYDVSDTLLMLSPVLQAPYFDAENGIVDIALYEVNTYLRDVTRMSEQFTAASAVKDGWDTKANAYILHLTILAVGLFLYGLAATISNRWSQIIFAVTASAFSLWATIAAVQTYTTPIFDLRTVPQAIDNYTEGAMLAYQGKADEALKLFEAVIAAVPDYTAAHREIGYAQMALGNYEAAIAALSKARELGDQSAVVAGNIAYNYYLLGRFAEAITIARQGAEANPSELWVQFDVGLNTLASGQIEAAQAEYQKGMQQAIQTVAEATAAGQTPSSTLWYSLSDAASGLDNLILTLELGEGTPPPSSIQNAEAVKTAAQALIIQLKSLAVSLEYSSKPPAGNLTATIADLEFGVPSYLEDGTIEYTVGDEFSNIAEVSMFFTYSGMTDGQDVIIKVYLDGEEDPSWRVILDWVDGNSGEYIQPLAIAYTNTFTLRPAEYMVEIYVDGHLAQTGFFYVNEAE